MLGRRGTRRTLAQPGIRSPEQPVSAYVWSYRPSLKRSAVEFVVLVCVAVALIFLRLPDALTLLVIIVACVGVCVVEYGQIHRG